MEKERVKKVGLFGLLRFFGTVTVLVIRATQG